ncbi:MAG: lysophospholipid acyltransferase family protein [Candidatus Pseudobacter hemicellulosilyticus]|uniref:Lysophospholipid acyltransferase family protein n=1 Tax=Candidatus Pseudobacter hemicellulosilyticus TaxID=3121375 RepID=A0AAJ6BHU9_9BACT|nr:MAG: lysophospholipid acyltransferase family protein [Pseudobacter sp.]
MYYLLFGFLYLLSLLPMRALYLFADAVYGLLYYVIGYRKAVVMGNLQIAFPEKTDTERKAIAKKFYHNFVDNFIETIKLLSASKEWLKEHFQLDSDPFPELYATGRKCQVHLGHNFNWEIANVAMGFQIPFDLISVYMPIKAKAMDRLFIYLRSRTGSILLPATDMKRAIVPHRHRQYALALVADQAPGSPANAYWLNFFGRPTAFVRGPERGARVGNIPVVFTRIYKTKRGRYRASFEVGALNPSQLPEGELTRRYIRFLEEAIRKSPDMWLWSHRRWKHEWKEEYRPLWIDQA